jgi:hypothetical protein
MTAAQNTIALKRTSVLGGLLAAAVVALIVAIVAIAITARPVAAPATATVAKPYVQSLHDKHLNLAPTITGTNQGEIYVQWLLDRHYQAMKATQPRVPAPPYPDQVTPIVRHPGGPFRAQ